MQNISIQKSAYQRRFRALVQLLCSATSETIYAQQHEGNAKSPENTLNKMTLTGSYQLTKPALVYFEMLTSTEMRTLIEIVSYQLLKNPSDPLNKNSLTSRST